MYIVYIYIVYYVSTCYTRASTLYYMLMNRYVGNTKLFNQMTLDLEFGFITIRGTAEYTHYIYIII